MKRDGWITKCIGDCFEYIKNGANIKQEKNASGYPITRIETLANGVFNRDRMGYANIFDVGKYCINILQDQDILMSHINSKAYIGRSVIYRKIDNEIIIHGMNLLRLIAKKDFLNPYYANYYFKTDSFKGDVAKIRKDAVNQSSMAISDLSKIKMPIPPLPEQSRIVEELDQLSNIIEKKRQQLSELDNLAQSIFYDMFGDPVTNEKGWEVKKLGEVCEPKSKIIRANKQYLSKDKIRYIDISSIDNSCNTITHTNVMNFGDAPSRAQQIVLIGDVLVSLVRPNLRNIALISYDYDDLVASTGFCVLRTIEIINSYYLLYCVLGENFTDYLMERTSGANYPAVREEDIKGYDLCIPPLSLQQLFAQKIEAIEKEKELIKQSIKETEILFNSRMDYYFG